MNRLGFLLLAIPLVGCNPLGGAWELPTAPPLDPCTDDEPWAIGGFGPERVDLGAPGEPTAVLAVGHSELLAVGPVHFGGVQGCHSLLSTVSWSSSNRQVATFEPDETQTAWLTGVRPGTTDIHAEVVLKSGRRHRASLSVGNIGNVEKVRVTAEPRPASDRTVVFEGTVALPPGPAGPSAEGEARLPFKVPADGLLDMVIDWERPPSSVLGNVCPGLMEAGLGCVPVIVGNLGDSHKPIQVSARVTAGRYTLWISNRGPGAEQVSYELGLRP